MKQYDSYLIYGCHFPTRCVNLITEHSSLKFFNQRLMNQFNCCIIELEVPHIENTHLRRYFLKIDIEQSDESIMQLDKLAHIDKEGFYSVLDMFDLDKMEPYLIGVPIVRILEVD